MTELRTAALLGAVSGSRSLLGPALIARHADPALARAVAGMAMLEMIADKTPWIPSRTRAVPLAGRAASGAIVGAAVVSRRRRRAGALVGAAAAVVAAIGIARLRAAATARLGSSQVVAGLVEDVVALGVGLFVVRLRT